MYRNDNKLYIIIIIFLKNTPYFLRPGWDSNYASCLIASARYC